MASRWVCGLLALTMALSLAGCGRQTAGTNASRWRQSAEVQNNALYQRELSDGAGTPEDDRMDSEKDWAYRADDRGQVKGFERRSADRDAGDKSDRKAATRGGQVENDLKDAGSDLKNAVRDAARSVGDTAEDAMDGMKDAARDASDSAKDAKR